MVRRVQSGVADEHGCSDEKPQCERPAAFGDQLANSGLLFRTGCGRIAPRRAGLRPTRRLRAGGDDRSRLATVFR